MNLSFWLANECRCGLSAIVVFLYLSPSFFILLISLLLSFSHLPISHSHPLLDVVNVNGQTYDGSSALLLLCKSITSVQLIDSVKLLVENGADINLANDHLEFPLLEGRTITNH